MKIEFLEAKRSSLGGGWTRKIRVNGIEYYCSVAPGKRVRIAFKPQGRNWGYHWVGRVVRVGGSEIWYCQDVGKSIGCKGLMEAALEHDFMRSAFGERYAVNWYFYDMDFNDPRRLEIEPKYYAAIHNGEAA